MLESLADSMGAWRFMDVLGMPFIKLNDGLAQDLMTWRWIAGIVRKQNDMIERGEDPFARVNALDLQDIKGESKIG